MKIKNYSETALEELKNSIAKNIENTNALEVLLKIFKEHEDEYPELKDLFIYNMNKFMTRWFTLVNEANRCSKNLQAKILTMDFINQYSDFNGITIYCYDKIDKRINEHTGRKLSVDILSHLACVVKAVVQNTRRNLGFDKNSKKYGKHKINKGTVKPDKEE